jgi:hypothetical protein
MLITSGGDISFYEDTGTTPQFFWDASTERLGIGTASPESTLHVVGTNQLFSPLRIQPASTNGTSAFSIRQDATQDRLTLGLAYSSASPVIGHRVKPSNVSESDATGFLSSSTSNVARTAMRFDTSGHIQFYNAPQQATAVNSVVAMTERMRIDSSGNVGIGSTSPASKLEIYSTATFNARTSGINIHRPGSYGQYASIAFNSASTFFSSTYNGAGAGSYGDFKWQAYDTTSTPVERMRIDSSGNLLVGKTSANTATEGVEFRSFGLGAFTRSGNQPIIANRTSNNGIILELQKDGTQVGVIGTLSSNLYVGSLDTGIYFNNSTDSIYAINTTTSAGRDNAIDLGVSATRFKDLYLGGGLYVGGTGTANKLDDYEEGTFTPTFRTLGGATSTITYSTQNGYYTKIGRMVYYQIQLNASSVSLGAGNTQLVLGGLPFSSSPNWGFCSIGLEGNFPSTNAPQSARVEGSIIILQTSNSSDARDNLGSYLLATSLQNNSTIICGGCYLTNS